MLLRTDGLGIWCETGRFHIDPWKPVPVAVVTHAHADHARPGMGCYYAAEPGAAIVAMRVGGRVMTLNDRPADGGPPPVFAVPYGERFHLGRAEIALAPAGHCLGSAQVCVFASQRGADRVAVAAGDYKRDADATCAPFEVVRCDEFITEATFGLPIYRWAPPDEVGDAMFEWCRLNADEGRVSFFLTYALGKAQRVLSELAAAAIRRGEPPPEVLTHGAVEPINDLYRQAGVSLPPTRRAGEIQPARGQRNEYRGRIVLAPPSAAGSPWIRRFGKPAEVRTAFVSGWMTVRGVRRRRGYDTGFVLSDHADWPGLIHTCEETGATRVLCTHGASEALAKYLREHRSIDARVLETAFGEEDEGAEAAEEEAGGAVAPPASV